MTDTHRHEEQDQQVRDRIRFGDGPMIWSVLAMSLAGLLALATLAALTVAVVSSQHHARADAIGRFDDRSKVAAQLLSGSIQQSTSQTRANAPAKLSGATVTADTIRKYVGPSGAILPYTTLFDSTGHQIASYPPAPDAARSSSGRAALRNALHGRTGTSGVVAHGRKTVLELVVPFEAGSQGRRVLVEALPVAFLRTYFGAALKNAAGRASGGTVVADTQGRLVAVNGAGAKNAKVTSALARAIHDGRTTGRIGPDRFTAQRVQDTGLVVGLVAPESALASDLPSVVWPRLAIGGFALALLAVFALLARVLADSRRVGAARREAQRANDAKSRFLSHITHELKQPLASIMGFGEILLQRPDLPEENRAEYTRIIVKSGRNLEALVNELLDISRIETGRVMLALEQVDVHSAVNEVFSLIQPLADERDIRLETVAAEEASAANALAVADPMRLRQILLNLVSNAIKYNREGGCVRVFATHTDHDTVVVAVSDEGDGMSAEDIAKLFQPFERLQAHKGLVKGTGLGLVITKGLVEAMDGHLDVVSEPGAGSTFSFELRAEHRGADEPAPGAPTANAAVVGNVVYVDDDPDNLQLVEEILAEARPGLQLRTAQSGAEGIALADEVRPDLLVLDLNLPDLSGEQVLRRFRSRPETADVAILVVSSDATLKNMPRLLETGADAYLTKPLVVAKFLDVVDRLIVAQHHQHHHHLRRHVTRR